MAHRLTERDNLSPRVHVIEYSHGRAVKKCYSNGLWYVIWRPARWNRGNCSAAYEGYDEEAAQNAFDMIVEWADQYEEDDQCKSS